MRSTYQYLRTTCLLLACLAGIASRGFCGVNGDVTRTYAFESLRRPPTPFGAVSGGFLGNDSGVDAVRTNPATLAGLRAPGMSASHQTWQSDLQEQWTGIALPVPWGGISVDASAFHAGALDGFAEDGTSTGSFRPMEILVGVGTGLSLRPGLRVGGAAQGLYLGGGTATLTGLSFATGLEWDVASVTIGVTAQNLGPAPRGAIGVYRLPAEFGISVRSDRARRASFGLGAARSRDGTMRGAVASSVRLHPAVSLMAGANYSQEAYSQPLRPVAGIEAHLGALDVGYAFSPNDEQGPAHVLSMTVVRASRPADDPVRLAVPAPGGSARTGAQPRPEPTLQPVPQAERFQVWGGTHRSAESAAAEIRALRFQKVTAAEVVALDNGTFRVRIARGLPADAAAALARRLQGSMETE
jgi:hypothetical protein